MLLVNEGLRVGTVTGHIPIKKIPQELTTEKIYKKIQVLNETLKKGADNKMICFLHPKSTQGVLIELCEEIKTSSSSY